MNHCISASCSSGVRTEGWNSSAIHFSAAAMSANAAGAPATSAMAAVAVTRGLRIVILPVDGTHRLPRVAPRQFI